VLCDPTVLMLVLVETTLKAITMAGKWRRGGSGRVVAVGQIGLDAESLGDFVHASLCSETRWLIARTSDEQQATFVNVRGGMGIGVAICVIARFGCPDRAIGCGFVCSLIGYLRGFLVDQY